MDMELVIDAIETSLRAANIFPAARLQLHSITHNTTFTDNRKVFVKFLTYPDLSRGSFEREIIIAQTHAEYATPLAETPLEVVLPTGEVALISAWNFVPNIIRDAKNLSYADGQKLGEAFNKFYATPPKDNIGLPVLWSPQNLPLTMQRHDAPADVFIKALKLRDITMETLDEHRELSKKDAPLSLTHGDPHSQNILWSEQCVPYLIDFETVRMDYIECDLGVAYQSYMQLNGNPDAFNGLFDVVSSSNNIDEGLMHAYVTAFNVSALGHLSRTENWEAVRNMIYDIDVALRKGVLVDRISFAA